MSKGLKAVAVVLVLLLLAGSTAISAATMLSVRAMAQELEQRQAQEEEESEESATSEDGVRIAGEYVVRPTTAVSDAYLSGDSSALTDREKETLSMASAILDQIITDGMTPFEKERAVYDWMVANLAYDQGALVVIPTTGADSDNPYGVLKYHNAVCVGYATTFRLFMQMLGIPCMVVHNNELYHSWDLVQLDDHWYHVDIYADVGNTGYSNFNVPDGVRLQQQSWDTGFFPAADSLTYNICWQNRKTVADPNGVAAALRQALDDGLDCFALSFPTSFSNADAIVAQKTIGALETALSSNSVDGMPDFLRNQFWTKDDSGAYCVLISFGRYSDQPSDPETVDQEALEQADAALKEAFGDLFYVSIYDSGYYY